MKRIRLEMQDGMKFDIFNCEVDTYRNVVNNLSYLLISEKIENEIEIYHHFPIKKIKNLEIVEL